MHMLLSPKLLKNVFCWTRTMLTRMSCWGCAEGNYQPLQKEPFVAGVARSKRTEECWLIALWCFALVNPQVSQAHACHRSGGTRLALLDQLEPGLCFQQNKAANSLWFTRPSIISPPHSISTIISQPALHVLCLRLFSATLLLAALLPTTMTMSSAAASSHHLSGAGEQEWDTVLLLAIRTGDSSTALPPAGRERLTAMTGGGPLLLRLRSGIDSLLQISQR